ncbi:MAG: phage virion morphogenesis protein [Pseudomonadota bacterium]
MPGASISITVDDKAVEALFARLRSKTGDMTPVMADIGEYLVRATDDRFRAQRDPDGRAWAPLSPRTWATKKNTRILTERARLRGSIAYRAAADSVRVGTNVVYGAVHQLGADETVTVRAHRRRVASRNMTAGKKKTASGVGFVMSHLRKMHIPARPYLGVSSGDWTEIAGIVNDYLTGV